MTSGTGVLQESSHDPVSTTFRSQIGVAFVDEREQAIAWDGEEIGTSRFLGNWATMAC